MKIDKYIALTGYTSRRKATVLIEEGKVLVNGKACNFCTRYLEGDTVVINGAVLKPVTVKPVFIAYHKPKGIICTSEKISGNIIDAINHPVTIYPVGRLDKDSEGLILLTNQGSLIDKITNPAFQHEKEYEVTLNLPLRKKFLEEVQSGMHIGAGVNTMPCSARPVEGAKRIFRIVLKQGLNRQIRKMCNVHNYQVLKLVRLRVMHIELGKLKPGEWRDLTEEEVKLLYEQTL